MRIRPSVMVIHQPDNPSGNGHHIMAPDAGTQQNRHQFLIGFIPVAVDKLGRLHEHAPGTAGRIKDLATERLDNFHHQPHHRTGGKKLTPALTFGHSKVAQKIFIDLAENVSLSI